MEDTPPTWGRLWEIFHSVRSSPPDERRAVLEEACAGDAALRERLQSLLISQERMGEGFLAGAAAGAMFDHNFSCAGTAWIGRTVGQFTIQEVIAEGGMGVVFAATQDEPRRTVALKLMRPGIASRSALRRFRHEWGILAQLQHENIAQIYDAGTHDPGSGGVPYFAMEYIAGAKSLIDYAQENDLNLESRLEPFARVCDGVQHGHQKGIIHRDLKPGNILVNESGVPKIIDFGVARTTDADVAATTLHASLGELVGTLHYMSPEQWQADPAAIDTRSDVYSLGVILYELITGELPYEFPSSSIFEAARVVREERPRRLSKEIPRHDELQVMLDGALVKDRAIRYESAAALGADIRRFLKHEPLAAKPPSRRYRLRKFIARNRALCGAAAAILFLMVAGSIASTWQAVRATIAERAAQERFDDVRGLANKVIFDLEDAIAVLPGATPARKLLVDEGLTYLDGLQEDAQDDPDLTLQVALAYQKLGDVQGNFNMLNLGDTQGARESYDKALRLIETILRAQPSSETVLRNYALLLCRRGEIESEAEVSARGDSDNPYYCRGREIIESLARDSDDPATLSAYAELLLRTAQDHFNRDHDNAANTYLELAIEIARTLHERFPDNFEFKEKYGTNLAWRGYYRYEAGDGPSALQDTERAQFIIGELRAVDPSNMALRRRHAAIMYTLARIYAGQGRAEEAIENGTQSYDESFDASQADPQNAQLFRDVGIASVRLGQVYFTLASNDSFPPEERITFLQESRRWFEGARENVIERDQRGWLDHSESHYEQSARDAIAKCDAAIATLEAETGSDL